MSQPSRLFAVLSKYGSIVLRARVLFIIVMLCALALKLIGSVVVPASFELQEVFRMATSQGQAGGPWVFVENQMLSLWKMITSSPTLPSSWWSSPPLATSADIKLLLLLLRLPALLFDVAMAGAVYLLAVTMFHSVERARLASLLWFLNPYTFLAVEALGVPDIAAALFTAAACILIIRGRVTLSAVALAIGTALKLYPFLLLPAFLLFKTDTPKTWLGRVALPTLPILGLAGYLLWVMPHGFSIDALTNYTGVTTPLTELFTFVPGSRISLVMMALVGIYFAAYAMARHVRIPVTDLVLSFLLVYFTFSDPYPQYFLWALPFLVLDITQNHRRAILWVLALVFLIGDWFIASGGFLTPSRYSFLLFNVDTFSALNHFLKDTFTRVFIFSFLQAGLFGVTFVYAIVIARGWFLSLLPTGKEKNLAGEQ
jgi:hypothetical protein